MCKASVEDPEWVLSKYEEAKELLADIGEDADYGGTSLPSDLRERVEDFRFMTIMDRCTTFGVDSACNAT